MRNSKNSKIERVLAIYAKFMDGQLVRKAEEAEFYGVHERSILRDIHDIRDFLVSVADQNDGGKYCIRYIRSEGGYRMEKENDDLTNLELLQLCKIIL